jgi:outer membrane protein TolC
MGMELFSTVEPEGDLGLHLRTLDVSQLLAWAKENRNELRETILQEEVDRLSVNLSMADRYPTFLLGGGYEMRDESFPIDDRNWNAGLTMNIPLFDGFASLARIKESRSRAQQGRFRRVQLEDRIEREVRSAYGDYMHWSEEIAHLRQELDTLSRARSNSFSVAEKIDLVRWSLASNMRITDARYEVCLANARLERAVGRSLAEEKLP